jgi:hypothetical protein
MKYSAFFEEPINLPVSVVPLRAHPDIKIVRKGNVKLIPRNLVKLFIFNN